MSPEELLLIAALTFLLAGTVKGVAGIGLPTAVVSILSQMIDPRQAIALLILPALVTNFWQVWRGRYFRRGVEELWPFALALFITVWIFAQLVAGVQAGHLILGIGCVIVLFVVTNLFGAPLDIPARLDRPAQIVAGSVSGVMGGLTSIWAPPMVIYLLGRKFPKNEFVGASGFLILAGTVPLLAGYWQSGLMTGTLAGYSALMIAPTVLGFAIGEKLRARISPQRFRLVVLVLFLLMGLNLIARTLIWA